MNFVFLTPKAWWYETRTDRCLTVVEIYKYWKLKVEWELKLRLVQSLFAHYVLFRGKQDSRRYGCDVANKFLDRYIGRASNSDTSFLMLSTCLPCVSRLLADFAHKQLTRVEQTCLSTDTNKLVISHVQACNRSTACKVFLKENLCFKIS